MFCHRRPIYLSDTDAAGVIYFASIFPICHEAYEASLAAAGIPLSKLLQTNTAVPIVRAEAQFRQPLRCGDRCRVQVRPHSWQSHGFSVDYQLILDGPKQDTLAATAMTQHCCIEPKTRQRRELPLEMAAWYQQWA